LCGDAILGYERLPAIKSSRVSITMRLSIVAAAVCLCLLPLTGGFAAAPPSQRADVPAPPAAAPASPAAAPSGDAAAKHAKRTACLKDAKAKKLVGADKTSFLKNCIAAP
jgi:hypothetical protein